MRALGAGTIATAALFAGGQTALAGEDIRLDFSAAVPGTQVDSLGQGTGFTTKMGGDGDPTSGINPALFTLNPALSSLSLTSTSGDAARPANQGSSNQDNAISVKVDPSSGPYKIETTLLAPWPALTQPNQNFGIYVGTSQQQYVKAVIQFIDNPTALPTPVFEPRPRMFYENAPSGATHATKGGLQSLPLAQRVKLQLTVNPANGEVRGYVSTNDGILVPIHNADAPVVIPSLADPNATNVTAGLISHNPATTPPVTATYDDFIVDVPSKVVSISPAQGAGGVAATGNVTVTFDQAVDLASASAGISLTGPSGPVGGTVTLSPDGKVATFDPASNLAGGSYTATVATSVTDSTGNPLLSGATSTFTVPAGDGPPPPPPPPPPPGGVAGAQCVTVPEPEESEGGGGNVTLTPGQMLINQRISQAAVRRANGIQAWLDGRIESRDLCGAGFAATAFGHGIVVGGPAQQSGAALPNPRDVVIPPRQGGGDTSGVDVSAAQLLISQRIAQAAVRRSNALLARLQGGLTGGDLEPGAITAAKLANGVGFTATPTPATPPAASTTQLAPPGEGGGRVNLTVGQLLINQRISQAAVRRTNQLIRIIQRGLTSTNFQAGSISAVSLDQSLRK